MIKKEIAGNIGVITLDNPGKYNALDAKNYAALAAAVRDFSGDDRVLVVKIQASGKAFCAGSNIEECIKDDLFELRAHYTNVGEMMKAVSSCKKPTIARVQGYALGGGCALAAACDMAIADEKAVFGLPEVELQIFPTTVMPPFLRAMSAKQAFELFFVGEKFDAARAVELGIINRAVPADKLDAEVDRVVNGIASRNPDAILLGKEAFGVSREMRLIESYDYLYNIMAMIASSKKAQTGFREFMETQKRRARDRKSASE